MDLRGRPRVRRSLLVTISSMSEPERAGGVRECSVARTLDLVGEKWALLAVREMLLGVHRFAEIARRTGAPRDILTTRLRTLEARGVLERRRYSDRPERFEYHLTAFGESLRPVIAVLRQWGDDHLAGEEGVPTRMDHSCGHELQVSVICTHCGEPLSATP